MRLKLRQRLRNKMNNYEANVVRLMWVMDFWKVLQRFLRYRAEVAAAEGFSTNIIVGANSVRPQRYALPRWKVYVLTHGPKGVLSPLWNRTPKRREALRK